MDKLKLFIDGKIAVITYQEEEFNHIKEYLSINNMIFTKRRTRFKNEVQQVFLQSFL